MIHRERLTATLDGEFVVFLIGMRVNRPMKLHKWLPVATAMPRMIKELYMQPELGFMHAEMWFSRTIVMVQYWRSMEQLLAYAKDRQAGHLPAWQAFNKAIGTDGSVGIWHETYAASAGTYENVYVNMPAFGLGKAGTLQAAAGGRQSAAGRLHAHEQAPAPSAHAR
jgi:GH15 family glucan-1,4-alpha-glucosidase